MKRSTPRTDVADALRELRITAEVCEVCQVASENRNVGVMEAAAPLAVVFEIYGDTATPRPVWLCAMHGEATRTRAAWIAWRRWASFGLVLGWPELDDGTVPV